MVKLLYFARLREDLGTGAEEIALPPEVNTVAALRSHLQSRGGAWASALAQGKAVRVAVNQAMAQNTSTIKAGDEIAFFPPVTGG